MESLRSISLKSSTRSFSIYLPFIIAFTVLLFLFWTTIQASRFPHDGIIGLQADGLISELDPAGPSNDKLQEGDIVVSIDGLPWQEGLARYHEKSAGDAVNFVVLRAGQEIQVTIDLVSPASQEIITRFLPLLLGLFFWGVSMGVVVFKPRDSSAGLFFLWCQMCCTILVAGVGSYSGPQWVSVLFNLLLWIIGPLSVHFHMSFPQMIDFKIRRILLSVLYTLGFLGALPFFLWGYPEIQSLNWYLQLVSLSRFFLAFNILFVVGLLILTYRSTVTMGTRGKIRLMAFGVGLAALPFVILTILPDALLKQPLIPYRYTFSFLVFLPLTYGYSIFRLHIIEVERHVNRGAAQVLAFIVLSGFYLILYALFTRVFPETSITPLLNTVLVLILARVFYPLNNYLQRFVDKVFYGGWYDYRLGQIQLIQGLEQITDLHELARTITNRLVHTLRLQEACAFFRGPEGDFSVIEVSSQMEGGDNPPHTYPILPRNSLTYLLKIGASERTTLQKELASISLTSEELELLRSEQINLWIPVIGRGQVLGLLALGPKMGGDVFSSEDMDILRSVVLQIGSRVENILLLTRLRRYASELELRVKDRTAELHQAKERVEAILGSVGDGVIVTDLGGKIVRVNTAFEQQSGLAASEVLEKAIKDLYKKHNDPKHLREMTSTLRAGDTWSGELTSQKRDGQYYDVQLTLAPVRDESGSIVSFVGIQRDITRQKELDRMKDIFIADISHELRTPITNIVLYLDILEEAPPERRTQYTNMVREQSRLLSKLVEDILDLTQLASAKFKRADFTLIDINLVVEQIISAHQPMANAAGLNLVFDPGSEVPKFWGEESQISRLISNLVGNALRYTQKGSVHLRSYGTKSYCCLEVQDTGLGIDPEDLPHIFDRFYRGRNAREGRIQGTGLGLAIVREIVNMHDANIEVKSERGKGTLFRVRFPARKG